MSRQTIEQVLPLLELIDQPAFCVSSDGSVLCNDVSKPLAPFSAQDLPAWLGSSADSYAHWDRGSNLVLPVSIGSQLFNVIVRPLDNGTLFLLSRGDAIHASAKDMTATAQVLRQPLNDLCSMAQQISETLEEMEDPILQQQTAAMSRHIYRLSRIACEMADLEQLQNGTYPVHPELLDLHGFLRNFLYELEYLCSAAGYRLETKLPEKQLLISADIVLLERALLNLFSNALKYGKKEEPIRLIVDQTPAAIHFRVQNAAAKSASGLLTAAFQRLTKRGLIPDPQWGIGLGLPLALYIARAMGGTIAVEENDGLVSVTMSVSRKRSAQTTDVRTVPSYDYTGGMRRSLVELADILPNDCFDSTMI